MSGAREPSERSHPRRPKRASDDEPVLPDVTRDERGEGWGDESGERDADWYHRERPPHHGD